MTVSSAEKSPFEHGKAAGIRAYRLYQAGKRRNLEISRFPGFLRSSEQGAYMDGWFAGTAEARKHA